MNKTNAKLNVEETMIYSINTYNNRINTLTKLTPFETLYGHLRNKSPLTTNLQTPVLTN